MWIVNLPPTRGEGETRLGDLPPTGGEGEARRVNLPPTCGEPGAAIVNAAETDGEPGAVSVPLPSTAALKPTWVDGGLASLREPKPRRACR
jgi:hypothetical protein